MNDIEYTWQSTPQLWMAMREGYCCCPECRPPQGFGRTKEEALRELMEREEEALG